MRNIVGVKGKQNTANGVTKLNRRSKVLLKVVKSNLFVPKAERWVERDEERIHTNDL